METQPEVKKTRINPDIWFYVAFALIMAIILCYQHFSHKADLREKDAEIRSLKHDVELLTPKCPCDTLR